MKNVTLKQGNQVLNLILQKDVPRGQLQDLLASGLLSDLLDANIQQVDRKKFREVLGLSTFKHDIAREGWKLLADVPFSGPFIPDIKEFLKPGEEGVEINEMVRRAKELNANLGQRDAEYLLENQELIPGEVWGSVLYFPGTIWENGDIRVMPYIDCHDKWRIGFTFCLGENIWRFPPKLVSRRAC